jgi:hypothetical protein
LYIPGYEAIPTDIDMRSIGITGEGAVISTGVSGVAAAVGNEVIVS